MGALNNKYAPDRIETRKESSVCLWLWLLVLKGIPGVFWWNTRNPFLLRNGSSFGPSVFPYLTEESHQSRKREVSFSEMVARDLRRLDRSIDRFLRDYGPAIADTVLAIACFAIGVAVGSALAPRAELLFSSSDCQCWPTQNGYDLCRCNPMTLEYDGQGDLLH